MTKRHVVAIGVFLLSLVPAYAVQLPLRFEKNVGQSDPRVRFIGRSPNRTIFLTANEAILGDVHLKFAGANRQARTVALDEMPTKTAYFIGADRSKWLSNVPSFAAVKYANIYPGIDVVFHGNRGQMEYDFVVAAGADPNAIVLELPARSRIDRAGDLVVGRDVRFRKPVVSQGAAHIDARFVRLGKQRFAFHIAPYDRTKELLIDPATWLGGTGEDIINGMALGPGGVFVTGQTTSADFPATSGRASSRTDEDAFVALLSSDLKTLVRAAYIGGTQDVSGLGSADDVATSIAVSPNGVYIAGWTRSGDFPALLNGAQPFNSGGNADGFISLFTTDLQTLTQSTCLGHVGTDSINALAVPPTALRGYEVFVAGSTTSQFFPGVQGGAQSVPNAGVFGNTNTTAGDAFVSVFSRDLKTLTQSTYLGGSEIDYATAISVPPPGGFVYVSGVTHSGGASNALGFPGVLTGAQPDNGAGPADTDGFVSFLTSDLTTLLNSTYFGGNGVDFINAMTSTVGPDGTVRIYVAGSTTSTNLPGVSNGAQKTFKGGSFGSGTYQDAFVGELDGTLTHIPASTYLGGTGEDIAYAIAAAGNLLYVTGQTRSGEPTTTAFPNTAAGLQPTYLGGGSHGDAFVALVGSDLKTLGEATYLGTQFDDVGRAILAQPDPILAGRSTVFVSGWSNAAPSFVPATTGGAQPSASRDLDGFVAKIAIEQQWQVAVAPEVIPALSGSSATQLQFNSVNAFEGTVTFTVSAPPGITASVSPAAISVPEGGSATTTLTVAVGPSVTPGTYSVEIDSTAGPQTSTTTAIVNVRATFAGVSGVITALQNSGCIDNAGVAASLSSKLSAAQTSRNSANVLNALINEIQAQSGKHISTSCSAGGLTFDAAATLIKDVKALMP